MLGFNAQAAIGLAAICIFGVGLVKSQPIQGSDGLRLEQLFAVPPAVELAAVASGSSSPVFVTNAGDARLFVVEQTGLVRIFQNGAFLATPFLDVTSLRNYGGERGLLGLAFHPNYPTTPYFFVHFTSDGDILPDGTDPNSGDNVIMRYTVSGNQNVADAASGKVLLRIPNPFSNHNGGMLEFGHDGFLYIGKGDGGSGNDPGNRAQNIDELLGKILRLDVDQSVNTAPWHGIPAGNPFIGVAGRDEIFLVGLRNPWRFSFDRTNGDLWIADVGQGAQEEIDRIAIDASASGRNLGWRVYEGNNCTGIDPQKCAGGATPINHTPPIAEYGHTGGRCSITGGYVYRGSQILALIGSYVYADYCTGEIFRLNGTTQELMLDTAHNISSFGEDVNGELYVTALSGQVLRLRSAGTTAAARTIAGRITSESGRGLMGANVILSGGGLIEALNARTNPFGYYRFVDVEAGQSYVVTPTAKLRSFTPDHQLITLLDDLVDINFVAVLD